MVNVYPPLDREGLRRLRKRDAERISRNLKAARDFLERPELRQGLKDPVSQGGLNLGYAQDVAPMDEDEVNHLNNPPVVERAPSPDARNNRRRREPTEADNLNSRVWRRRAPDGAQYMTPPLYFHPSDDEDEKAFARNRQMSETCMSIGICSSNFKKSDAQWQRSWASKRQCALG
jgi:hypothetical protein